MNDSTQLKVPESGSCLLIDSQRLDQRFRSLSWCQSECLHWAALSSYSSSLVLKSMAPTIGTSCYLSISCQQSDKYQESTSYSNRTVPLHTELEKQFNFCRTLRQSLSHLCFGLQTVQTLIQWTTRSGASSKSECIEPAYKM